MGLNGTIAGLGRLPNAMPIMCLLNKSSVNDNGSPEPRQEGPGGRAGGWPRALTACLHLSLVQDLQAGAPAHAAGEKDPGAAEAGHRDGGFLPSICQTLLPLSRLKLCSQFPQNL